MWRRLRNHPMDLASLLFLSTTFRPLEPSHFPKAHTFESPGISYIIHHLWFQFSTNSNNFLSFPEDSSSWFTVTMMITFIFGNFNTCINDASPPYGFSVSWLLPTNGCVIYFASDLKASRPSPLANFMTNIFKTQPASPSNTLHPLHIPTALECLVFFSLSLVILHSPTFSYFSNLSLRVSYCHSNIAFVWSQLSCLPPHWVATVWQATH